MIRTAMFPGTERTRTTCSEWAGSDVASFSALVAAWRTFEWTLDITVGKAQLDEGEEDQQLVEGRERVGHAQNLVELELDEHQDNHEAREHGVVRRVEAFVAPVVWAEREVSNQQPDDQTADIGDVRLEEGGREATLRHAQDLERVAEELGDVHPCVAAERGQHDPVRKDLAADVFRDAGERAFLPRRPVRRVEHRRAEEGHQVREGHQQHRDQQRPRVRVPRVGHLATEHRHADGAVEVPEEGVDQQRPVDLRWRMSLALHRCAIRAVVRTSMPPDMLTKSPLPS